jgi:hypothetical protein
MTEVPSMGEIAPLACGRDAAVVWDRAEAGLPLDAHGRDCPHCSAAYAEARQLDVAVHRMAEEPVQMPAQAVEAVLGRVLETARSRIRPEEALRLDSPLGPNRLARAAAATALRAVVDAMDGMRARSCRIAQPGPDTAIDVALTVVARLGLDLAYATAQVRRTVFAVGEQALGLPVRRVDIEVVDLWEA